MTKMETALASERTHLMARVETAERERDNARAEAALLLDRICRAIEHLNTYGSDPDDVEAILWPFGTGDDLDGGK